MARALAWLLDSNEVTIHEGLVDADSIGVTYRWDFGDGSPFSEPNGSNQANHTYTAAGDYIVRVEATNALGVRELGGLTVQITADMVGQVLYFASDDHQPIF